MIKEQNNETRIQIITLISQFTDVALEEIRMDSELICDLGYTSFDLICLLSTLEEEFGVKGNERMLKGIKTVENVESLINKHQRGMV